MKIKHHNIPIFLPEESCPHRCIFCDQHKISGTVEVPSPKDVREIIETHLSTIKNRKYTDIAFFGGSFTGMSLEMQEEYLKIAFQYIKNESVRSIRLSTRPDYIDEENLNLLKNYGVRTIELGAQSFDDEVLKMSNRGHTAAKTIEASQLIKEKGFQLGLQMMIGLPGDTEVKSLHTASEIIRLGANNTRIYPTLILKNTALARMFKEEKYKPMSIEKAVSLTKKIMLMFEKGNVKILRVGLHPSEELDCSKSLIAGPYHPSFKGLVLTERWADIFCADFPKTKLKELHLHINPLQINYAIGYKSQNKNYLIKLGYKPKFIPDVNIAEFEYSLENEYS